MSLRAVCFGALSLVALALPVSGLAACYAVYSDAYRSFYKKASGMNLPARAGNFSSIAECRSFVGSMLADPQYRYDKGLQATQCACDGGGGGSTVSSGGSFQQQIVSLAVSSLLNALLAGLTAPSGPSGDEIRRQVQQQWDDEEVARKAAEKKRHDDAFKTAQQTATALLGSRPAGRSDAPAAAASAADDGAVYLGSGKIPALLRTSGAVSEAEWATARQWQARIDELWAKSRLTQAEALELAALEARREALWKRAVSVPGLTQRERDALRLKLHVTGSGALSASTDELIVLREKAAAELPTGSTVLTAMVESSMTYGIQNAIETWGEEASERVAGKYLRKGAKVVKFGDAYFVADSALAIAQGKPEEIGEPAVTWTLGKLVARLPSAALSVGTAQGVGAVTVGAAKKSFEVLLEETDKMLPGFLPEGGVDAYWERMKAGATAGQKFGFEALGW